VFLIVVFICFCLINQHQYRSEAAVFHSVPLSPDFLDLIFLTVQFQRNSDKLTY
jgi:hypothetical protein